MNEPILRQEDLDAWEIWRETCLLHTQSQNYKRHVHRSIEEVIRFYKAHPNAYLAWSAGKDSTALCHLVRVACGLDVEAMSIKDDLDFPGEEKYLAELAEAWGLRLTVLHPSFSLQQWVADHVDDPAEDMHSRGTALSSAGFYSLIEEFSKERGKPGVYLGLRASESKGRRMNRRVRGTAYQKKDGEWVCQPLGDWGDKDVFAYLLSHDIEPLPLYKCCGWQEPGKIRKSWWIGGQHSTEGALAWLRRYYPSLYTRLTQLTKGGASRYV